MLTTVLLALAAFVLLSAAMAVGIVFGRKPLQGSCGGLNAEGGCGLCGRSANQLQQCPDRRRQES